MVFYSGNVSPKIALTCPRCKFRAKWDASFLEDAIQENRPLLCIACGNYFAVLLIGPIRATELRNEADGKGAEGLWGFYHCPTCGCDRKRKGRIVEHCPQCGDATFDLSKRG